MRLVTSLIFSFAVLANVAPASAHTAGVSIEDHPPLACFPWSGCRK